MGPSPSLGLSFPIYKIGIGLSDVSDVDQREGQHPLCITPRERWGGNRLLRAPIPPPGLQDRFSESQKLALSRAPGCTFWESEDSGDQGTHGAVGVWSPDRGSKRTLQKEILGNDKEAGQHAEEAGDVCYQAQRLLQAQNKSDNHCPKVRAPDLGPPHRPTNSLLCDLRKDSARLWAKSASSEHDF